MTEAEVKAALSDFDALWLTLWAEARGEPIEGQIGVACVIRNRVQTDLGHDGKPDWWGEGYKGVCLAPQQFSCWLPLNGVQNHAAVMARARVAVGDLGVQPPPPDEPIVRQVKAVATNVMNGAFLDRTQGAVQYLTRALYGTQPPIWAQGVRVIQLGAQVFVTA